ncbi:MAG: replication-associated recombination protein A [Oscillospiraceae bacterium]|nr:replication-associated recombination protein A [Oscillospiraceae bacterium]
MYRPLADELRPTTMDDVVGQKHILGENGLLRRIIASGTIPNMIFYGPSGIGKTTVAEIIAKNAGKAFYRLNATTAGISDIKAVIGDVDTFMAPNGVLLYLDEIQYFNKKQQQSLLEFMEDGRLTLIASTTENPYFYVYNAVLSRSTVFEFKELKPEDIIIAVRRGVKFLEDREGITADIEEGVLEHISRACGGDVRKALNAVELLFYAGTRENGRIAVTMADAEALSQKSGMRYDKDGDSHYDIISALQKSIRGSDPDAALHYLARLLEAGDMISPCRRLMVIACEDVGLAYPQAIAITKSCIDAAMMLGLPEARIPLADCAVMLATAPKSNSAYMGIDKALSDIRHGRSGEIPRQLQNVHADTTGSGIKQNYRYPHDFPNHYVEQQYLPDAIKNVKYYEYGENKNEKAAKAYWEAIKNGR